MKKYISKIIYSFQHILFLSILFFVMPVFVHAATFYFDPQDTVVGLTGSFDVGLDITADQPINTVAMTLYVPEGLQPVDISDGNSIINFWVDKPAYNATAHTITFSGIIPGGFSGKGARLLLIKFEAEKEGQFTLKYDTQQSKVYLNSPHADADSIEVQPLTLTAEKGKDNISNIIPDTTPPEAFDVTLVQNTTLVPPQWFAVFATQDKGVGLKEYQIAESEDQTANPDSLNWHAADSPYLLQDQTLSHYVYVKAVDKNNNERIEFVKPVHILAWDKRSHPYILMTILGILMLLILYFIGTKFLRLKRR